MKTIELKCESCGAIMQVNDDKSIVSCPYCKNSKLIHKEPDITEKVKEAERITYAKETGRLKAEEDAKGRKKQKKFAKVILTLFIIGIIIGVAFAVNYYSLEHMEDPFTCMDVKFSGIDSKGKAEVISNSSCEGYHDINYNILKNENLKEGQTITIEVTSDKYRFDIYSKEYKVTGLSMPLTDLNQLTDEMITKLHSYSENHIKNKPFGVAFHGEVVSITPYKMYLYTNGTTENILYDVYKTTIKTKSGNTYDKYIVGYFENFLILTNEELFSYDRLWHCGQSIKAGDPNVGTANSKDYAGYMNGFETIEEFKTYLNQENDGSFKITER